MYELSVQTHFSAAHHLKGYEGSCEAHHGHNWDIEVYVRGDELDDTGLLIDFKQLRRELKAVIDTLDHCDLNRVEAFSDYNPTSEHIARFIYDQLARRMIDTRVELHRVTVHETRGSCATYWAS